MKYFVGAQETKTLDDRARSSLRGSFVRLSDGICHFELTGPEGGEIVVLTGGLTVPLFYWDGLIEHLHNHGLRTLTYSAYGRGYSDRLKVAYDDALLVRQLTELVEALGITKYHLVGTSMGAVIAMGSLADSTAVTTLTLVGPAGLSKPPPTRWLLRNDRLASVVGRRFGRKLLEGHLGHNVRDPESAATLAEMVRAAFQYEGSLYALFSTLQNFPLSGRSELFRRTGDRDIPSLLIWGDDDQVTPIDSLPLAQELLRPRQCHVIQDCGHMAPLERAQEVAELIASFTSAERDRKSS